MIGPLRVDRRQAGILADRYLDVLLGDPRAVLLLLGQAPLIGALVAGVWSNARTDSATLYFVLALSAFFLGAVNAAREIVKERALFVRERLFNLDVGAYVVSKYRVQVMILVVQCTLLTGIVDYAVPLKVSVLVIAPTLMLTALVGTAVGLLVSAVAGSADKAVMAVPLLVIPQILFSRLVLPGAVLSNWTAPLQKAMPVHWAFEVLDGARSGDALWTAAPSVLILSGMVALGYTGAVLALARVRA